jgi:membrane associated rhomboid family serine protease
MTPAPVGQRCPEHSGRARGPARVATGIRRAGYEGTGALVTRTLIALNVLVYLAELAQGSGINGTRGSIYDNGVLYGPQVAHGDWWRLITAAFLHYGPFHLGMNMLALWWFGQPVEAYLGRARFLLLYLVSGLAGSAGALVMTPTAATVGASGAIFGILGAALVLERQRTYVLGGSAMAVIAINLVFSFTFRGISIGGHVGGLVGGALCMLALSRFGRGHAAYGRLGAAGIAGVLAIGVLSVAVAYWKVRGYA